MMLKAETGSQRKTGNRMLTRTATQKMAESGEPQANNPLSRKLNKILETRLDNDKVGAFQQGRSSFGWRKIAKNTQDLLFFQEMVEALKALSTFFVDNSLRSRRNLRGDIEKRSLAINESFESAFREVKQVSE